MRTAYQIYWTLQALFLGLLVVLGAWHLLPGLERIPQRVAATSLGLGLVVILPLRFGGWGMTALYGWLARSRTVHRWLEGYRPLQFAAVISALFLAAGERLPQVCAWLLRDVQADWAARGPAETLVLWSVLSLIGGGIVLLLVTFGVLVIAEAFGWPGNSEPAEAATLVVLWNMLVAILAGITEVTDVFSSVPAGLGDWRWWLSLGFSLALARSVLLVTLLMAADWLSLPMEAVLAPRAYAVRIGRRATALALGAVCLAFLWLEPRLGVAGAAALIAVASQPLALALEALARRA